jgi:hypothetical protein
VTGKPMKAVPAVREPGPRQELMDELGIDPADQIWRDVLVAA